MDRQERQEDPEALGQKEMKDHWAPLALRVPLVPIQCQDPLGLWVLTDPLDPLGQMEYLAQRALKDRLAVLDLLGLQDPKALLESQGIQAILAQMGTQVTRAQNQLGPQVLMALPGHLGHQVLMEHLDLMGLQVLMVL